VFEKSLNRAQIDRTEKVQAFKRLAAFHTPTVSPSSAGR
jgi:hypothetical protein